MIRKRLIPYILSLLIIFLCAGAFFGNYYLTLQFKLQDEFAVKWVVSNNWIYNGNSPYDETTKVDTQSLLLERGYRNISEKNLIFTEPAFNVLYYLMFGFVNYEWARAIWMLLVELSIIGIILLSIKLSGLMIKNFEKFFLTLFVLSFYPSIRAILFASSYPIYIFLILLAIWLAINDKGTASGILFALTIGTIEIGIIIAIFSIIWRLTKHDSSVGISYLSGLLFLIIVSIILFPGWLTQWFSVLIKSFEGSVLVIDTPLLKLSSVIKGAENPLRYILHIGTAVYLLFEWFGAFGKSGRVIIWKFALTVVVAFLFNIFSNSVFLLFMIMPFFLIIRFIIDRWKLFGKIISWLIISFLVGGYWFLFNNNGGWSQEDPAIILLSLPLITFIGVNWIRWWAIKKPTPLLG